MKGTMAVGAVLAAAIAVTAAAHSGAGPKTQGTVYVTERQAGSVSAFDAASGAVHWTRAVGSTPIGVTLPRKTGKVYTSNEGSDSMSVLDARSGAPIATIPMGPHPHHLMASRDGDLVYVGEFGGNTIGVVDTDRDERIAGFVASPLADARTHAVFVTRDGDDLYATNTRADRTMQGDVAKLDAETGELLCNTRVGIDPSEILATPNGEIGYVSVRGENRIKELDLRGRCPSLTGREATIGTQPDTLQLTRHGKTLVVALRGTPAQISLLDTESFTVRLVDIPGHTTTGHHWLSREGKLTFVAVEGPGGLAVVDNVSGKVVSDYLYPGGGRPHGVYFQPSRRQHD